MKKTCFVVFYLFIVCILHAEDGYRLWLRYDKINDNKLLQEYRNIISGIHFTGSTLALLAARDELINGLEGLLGKKIVNQNTIINGSVLAGTIKDSTIHPLIKSDVINHVNAEGFVIQSKRIGNKSIFVITVNTDAGVLYGCFHFLRLAVTFFIYFPIVIEVTKKLLTLSHICSVNYKI